jgi:conjugal transfer pilin signal peptidase TrbI
MTVIQQHAIPTLGQRFGQWWSERAPLARKRMPWAISGMLFVVLFSQYFALGWVVTESVGASAVLVIKGTAPKRGELFAFEYLGPEIGNHRKGEMFVKFAQGMPGDSISREGREFFMNGKSLGVAKERSMAGVPLEASDGGVVPEGSIYAYAPHKDALDSRYKLQGLVPRNAVIGRAIRLF